VAARADLTDHRHLGPAPLHRDRAAGMEPAAGGGSIADGQRVWNRQPAAGRSRTGGRHPAAPAGARAASPGPPPARPKAAPACRDEQVRRRCVRAALVRRAGRDTFTATSSARYSTADRSCVMNRQAKPRSRWRSASRLSTEADGYVEGAGRFVGHQEAWLGDQGRGDTHPLPLATGQLVRRPLCHFRPALARGNHRRAGDGRRRGASCGG